MAEYPNRRKTIQDFAKELENKIKSRVPKNTGNLSKSVTGKVDGEDIDIMSLPYLLIVDKGISGKNKRRNTPFGFKNKKPPIKDLIGFAKRKRINVWALQNSIFKNGFRGKNFVQPVLNNELDNYSIDLAQATWDDFADDYNKLNE